MSEKYNSPILEQIRNHKTDEDMTRAHRYARDYMDSVDSMPVFPKNQVIESFSNFELPLDDDPVSTESCHACAFTCCFNNRKRYREMAC